MRTCPNCGNSTYKEKIREESFVIVSCGECGLVYLLNPPDEKEIYEDYYKIEFTKDDYRSGSDVEILNEIFEINNQRVKLIKKLAGEKDFTLLDIGCGSGLFLKSCTDAGFNVSGIDVSKNALKFAKESFGLNVDSKTVSDLSAEGKKYDIITMWHVLEHVLNPVEELKKIMEILNGNGVLLIEVPNFNSIKFKLSGYKWKGGNHPLYHRSFFTSKTLRDTFRKSGFNNIEQLRFTYKLGTKSFLYNLTKKIFNVFSADAFLDFAVRKK
jgi:SAM-dependent methyltransferase